MRLQALMQYRADFAVGVLATFGFSAIGPIFQFLIYQQSDGYPGWTFEQILLFQAMVLLGGGIREALFGGIRVQIGLLVQGGELDRLLLRPYPPLLLILTSGFSPYALGTLLVGACAVAWAAGNARTDISASAAVLFLLFVAAGVLLALAVQVLYCVLTVRWVYPGRLGEAMDKVRGLGEVPLEVYPPLVRTVLSTLLPLSVATHWPVQTLLGRVTPVAGTACGGAVAVWLLVRCAWARQLRRYASAGG
jgi:ABC-2 type transport system permease protein